jgi:hypothetical protein
VRTAGRAARPASRFAATIQALALMSSPQMGWYRNEPAGTNKTWPDTVLCALARGLPDEHGISLKVAAGA